MKFEINLPFVQKKENVCQTHEAQGSGQERGSEDRCGCDEQGDGCPKVPIVDAASRYKDGYPYDDQRSDSPPGDRRGCTGY